MPETPDDRVRVLVVDDDQAFVEAMMMTISQDDRLEIVGAASDGAEALDLAKRLRPDVMLLDLEMPRVDGIQTMRKLRRRKRKPAVVVLTGVTDPETLVRAQRQAPHAFLQKTVDSSVVTTTLVLVATMAAERRAA